MTIYEMENKINLVTLIEQNYKVKRIGNALRINPCPVCGNKDHFTVYPESNSYSSFSGCCNGGSVYKYLQEVMGLNEKMAFEELERLAGETTEYKKSVSNSITPKEIEQETHLKDYTKTIIELYNNQSEEDKQYFSNRGIPSELVEKYKLCIGNIKNHDGARAIIPTWKNGQVVFYNARALTLKQEEYRKYDKPSGASTFFNIDYLKSSLKSDVIIITEGEFDALSIEAMGYKAIAIGGVQYIGKLMKEIERTPTAKELVFLTAFDNDEAGRQATNKLRYKNLEIPERYKDVNEWCVLDSKGLKNELKERVRLAKRPDAISEYLNTAFITDIEKFKTYKDKKTGFKNLDKVMGGLYAGLYVIGGISSLGKTTFIHQLADQLAEQGDHIIYFSLEQSKLELVSKSLARLTAKTDYNKAVSGISIRCGNILPQVIDAAETYEETAQRISIIEGNFNTNVNTMRNYIEGYINKNNVKPVVVIDYLQIIPGDPRLGDKQRIDSTVTELKRISRDFDITLFVISSLNRGNYLTPIDFESFKESGGIEYTADVVWGIQLQAIHDDIFNKDGKVKEKREKIKEAKAADPRKIELVCLKNRNGISSYSCGFIYQPKFDLFNEHDFITTKQTYKKL